MAAHRWQGKYFYQTLGVEPDASLEEIKSEYRWLARRFHPDQNDGDERAAKRFRDITEAYEVLSKSDERARYDAFLASGKSNSNDGSFASQSPRRDQAPPQEKPPYRAPGGTASPREQKPPPRKANQGSNGDNSKYKGQPAPKNQFDAEGSGCLPALFTILGSLLLFILIAVATSSNTTSSVEQSSQITPQQAVEPANNYTVEDFCEMVFSDDRTFESRYDIYAFWSKLDDGLERLGDSASTVRFRGETLLSRTVDLVNVWDSQSENAWQASWEGYLRAESSLAAQCGFTLE